MSGDKRDSDLFGAAIQAAVADVRAPDHLRARVAAQRQAPEPRTPRRLPVFGLAGAAFVAAAALALVIVLGGGDERPVGPTLEQATLAAVQPAVGPPPAEDDDEPALVKAQINGLQFPYWDDDFGLNATGVRRERLEGREALTVTYENRRQVVGYTIVAGAPLPVPKGAEIMRQGGVEYAFLRQDGINVVTWRRAGHTCVIASREAGEYDLIKLAAWTGAGGVGGYPR
jgi:hypothetical protein